MASHLFYQHRIQILSVVCHRRSFAKQLLNILNGHSETFTKRRQSCWLYYPSSRPDLQKELLIAIISQLIANSHICEIKSACFRLLETQVSDQELSITFLCFLERRMALNTSSQTTMGLAWWSSGWESACQCWGCGFDPWSGKISHAMGQLNLCTTAIDPEPKSPYSTTTEALTP